MCSTADVIAGGMEAQGLLALVLRCSVTPVVTYHENH